MYFNIRGHKKTYEKKYDNGAGVDIVIFSLIKKI